MGCHSLLQRIFLTQGSNPHLLDRRQILYHLSHRETKEKLVFAKEKNKEGIPIKKTKTQMPLSPNSSRSQHIYIFPGDSNGEESACNAGDPDSIPGLGRSSGEGNGNPLQYSCLENSTDRGPWQVYSPWGHKESDMIEQLTLPLSFHV